MRILISDHQSLRQGTVIRLLDVLVENEYLQVFENEYDIVWGVDLTQEDLRFVFSTSSTEDVIDNSLEKHLRTLLEDYGAVTRQLETALEEVDHERLKRKAGDLEKEINEVRIRLSALQGPNSQSGLASQSTRKETA
jgi:hypothetical protein